MFLLLWDFWSHPLPPCTKCMEWEGGTYRDSQFCTERRTAPLFVVSDKLQTPIRPLSSKTVTAKLVVFLSFGCRWVGFLFGPGFCLCLVWLVWSRVFLGLVLSGFPPTPWHLIWDRAEVKASQTADPYFNNSNLLPPSSVTNLFYNKVHCTLL